MTDANQEYTLGGFGARLKAAREAMDLTQKDAAFRLHLNPDILQILETENFEKAPPVTFIRGYLRSYARLLNFSEEEINAALTQSGLESHTTAPIIPSLQTETLQMSDRHVQRVSTYVILGLFIFVGIWWGLHSSNKTPVTQTVQRPSAEITQVQPIAAPAPVTTTTTTTAVAAPEATAPVPATSTAPAATPIPPAPPMQPGPVVTAPPAATGTPTNPTATAVTPPTPPAAGLPETPPGALAITPVPPAATPDTDTPKKHTRRHRQDGNVSGVTMALPEPGL